MINTVKKYTIVFDFDWSLIDENSDTYIAHQLDIDTHKKIGEWRKDLDWTETMQEVAISLNSKGFKENEFTKCFSTIPFREEMFEILKLCKENEYKIFIVSDANSYYIESILKSYQIIDYFEEIHTNPAFWKEDMLYIERYHNNEKRPEKYLKIKSENNIKTHECKNCNPNICKGTILKEIIKKTNNGYIYIGDGSGDYCAATHLRKDDHLLMRVGKGFGLEKTIQEKGNVISNIHKWEVASDLLNLFKKLLL